MTINYPDYPSEWQPLANDAEDSAHQGSPMSRFAKGGRAGCKPFEIVVPKEHTEKMAKGGLAGQAKNVASAGVGGDTMVIHINKDEYKKLCEEWGEPTMNPHTGMPQFTPFYKQSWFAPVAALAGTALMATGVGSALGGALLGETLGGTTLAGATGISGLGSATLGTLAGNAALSAGIGGLTGGGKGALTSGLLGAAGTVGASALGNYLGGANTSGLQSMNALDSNAASVGAYGPQVPAGSEAAFKAVSPDYIAPSSGGGGIMSGLKGYLTDPNKMAAAAVGLGALAGGGGGSEAPADAASMMPKSNATDPNLTRRLDTTPLNRTRLKGPIDYYNYGSRPETQFYAPAEQPTVQAAQGGPLSRYVEGGGTGRSDSIDAKLSDGEYVIDSETVALLGDGSSKAGAQRLDQFRANIRKQKGKALSQGKISPDAHSPDRYLMGGRA
jgi:hypothetical protein